MPALVNLGAAGCQYQSSRRWPHPDLLALQGSLQASARPLGELGSEKRNGAGAPTALSQRGMAGFWGQAPVGLKSHGSPSNQPGPEQQPEQPALNRVTVRPP